MLAPRRPDVWPAADLAFRRAVERVWGLEPPALVEQVGALGSAFARGARSPSRTSTRASSLEPLRAFDPSGDRLPDRGVRRRECFPDTTNRRALSVLARRAGCSASPR
jgi:hypothetical protein